MRSTVKILHIEDNSGDRLLLETMLSQMTRFDVSLSGVSDLASGVLMLQNEAFDLVLLDLQLPDSKGLDSIKSLRKVAPNLAYLIVSNNEDSNLMFESVEMGAQDFLLKRDLNMLRLEKAILFSLQRIALQEEKRSNEVQYQSLFNINPESIIIYRFSDDSLISVNETFTKTFGWTLEECQGKTLEKLGLWLNAESIAKTLTSLSEEEDIRNLKGLLNRKTGEPIPCRLSFSSYMHEGERLIMGVLVSLEHEQQQRSLLNYEKERFQLLIENGPDLYFYVKEKDRIDYISPQVKRQLGYLPDEFCALSFEKFMSKGAQEEIRRLDMDNLLKKREPIKIRPFEVFDAKGRAKKYDLTLIPVRDEKTEQVSYLQGIARDITDEEESLRLLEESNKQNLSVIKELKAHQFAIDNHNMVVVTDLQGVVKFANDQFCSISGYSKEELIGASTRLLKSDVHSDKFFKNMWTTLLEGRVWQGNICNKRKDGSLYWLATTIIPRFDLAGELEEFIALRTDITELQETQRALETSSRNFREVMNSNPNSIWSIDVDFKLLTYNKTFEEDMKALWNHQLIPDESMIEIEVFPQDFLNEWKGRYEEAFKGKSHTYIDEYSQEVHGFDIAHQVSIFPTYSDDNEVIGANVVSQNVTDRIKAKRSLKSANRRLREAQNLAKVADWEFNLKTRDFVWSNNINEVLGHHKKAEKPKALLGLIKHLSPLDRDLVLNAIRSVTREKTESQVLVKYRNSQSENIWLECRFSPELDEQGKVVKARGVLKDVSDLVKAQKKEHKQKSLFMDLASRGPIMLSQRTIAGVYSELCGTLYSWLDKKAIVGSGRIDYQGDSANFERKHFCLPQGLKKEFEFLTKAIDQKANYRDICTTASILKEGLVHRANGALISLLPFLDETDEKILNENYPLGDLRIIGIYVNQKLHGCFFVFFPYGTPDYYSDELIEVLIHKGSSIMELLENKKELDSTTEYLNQALEAADSAIWTYDFGQNTLSGDENLYQLMGLEKGWDKPLSLNQLSERLEQESIDKMVEIVNSESDTYQNTFRFRAFNEEFKWFEDRAKVIERDAHGAPLKIVGIRMDVSQRVNREEQLLLLESTVKNANEGILITDAKDIGSNGPYILYANKAFEKISGYTLEEILGRSPKFLQGPATDPHETKRMGQALKNKQAIEVEILNYHKNGNPYYVSISIVPVVNQENQLTHFVALERDVTEEREQREQIKALITRFELAARISKIGIFELNPADNSIRWENNMYELYEVDPQEFKVNMDSWLTMLHKEDRVPKSESFFYAIENDLEEFNSQFRAFTKSGLKYISAIAKIFRDSQGNPTKVVGMNWDITETEKRRIELDKVRLNTQALINNTQDHMWSVDPRFHLLSANQSYLNYLKRIGGRDFTIKDDALDPVLGKGHNERWRDLYGRALGGERIQLEIKDDRPDGTKVFVISLYPIYNSDGIITGVACYSFDNTETVNYMSTIESQNQNLKDIAWMQSHVMRAPVARVLGLVDLLKEENHNLDPNIAEILHFIEESTGEMDSVIKEITAKTDRSGLNLK